MSFDALAWAGRCRAGSAGRKLVLLALADRHNTEESVSRPSVSWIAEWADLNRKTVIMALQELERMGLISDSGLRSGRTLQIKAYHLHLGTVPKTEQFLKRNSTTFSAKESQKRDTDTITEPVPSEAKASSGRAKFPPPPGVSDEQWKAFREQRKKPLNARSYLMICNKLVALAEDGWPPGDMIDLAIERGWETAFAPRTFGNERSGTDPTTTAVQRIIGGVGAHC